MTRVSTIVALAVLLAAPALAEQRVRTLEEQFEIAPSDALRLDVPVAQLEVRGTTGDEVRVEMDVTCGVSSRCRERAEDLRLEVRDRSGAIEVRVEGYSKNGRQNPEIDIVVEVPAGRSLEIDLGVGTLDVASMEGDITISHGVGEVTVTMAEDAIHEVSLDVGVGDADIWPRRENVERSGFLFLGNELRWDGGPGRADVVVDLGVGEARVLLN